MFSRLPMYQRQGSIAFKKDLTNIKALCHSLGQPEKSFPSVHVAGTNGKGSTSHMIAAVLQEAGYKVGLYTSPHLKDFRERIRINGLPIEESAVISFIENNREFLKNQGLSFFEMTVGMAFDHFDQQQVDIAVIEVGLGGRLDSTNILDPLVSVITNIGYDHQQFLGETLQEIAVEKGGIIKPKTPVVIGEYQEEVIEIFEKVATDVGSPLYLADRLVQKKYNTDLLGLYQLKNVKTAVQTVHLLRKMGFAVSEQQLERGLTHVVDNTGLKGRWQVLGENPKIVCDTAHNKEGLTAVMAQLREEKFESLHMVIGVVNDKQLDQVLTLLPSAAVYYFCKPEIPRGLPAEELLIKAKQYELIGQVYESVEKALEAAIANSGSTDFIYIGGSTFVVAELNL